MFKLKYKLNTSKQGIFFIYTKLKLIYFLRHLIAKISKRIMSAILVGIIARNDDFRDTCNQKNEVW